MTARPNRRKCLSSSVSLPFLDESYGWLRSIIMGIQNRATSQALFSDLNFNILSHTRFFVAEMHVLVSQLVIMTEQHSKENILHEVKAVKLSVICF